MDDTNLHDQLLAQLAEQQAAVEEIAALLAEDSTAELIQVQRAMQPMLNSLCAQLCSSAESAASKVHQADGVLFAAASRTYYWSARDSASLVQL